MSESAIYRDLIQFKPDDLSPNAWAVRAGVSRTVWADMRRHGNPSRRTLEKLLNAAGSSLAEFEALRVLPAGARPHAADRLADQSRAWSTPAPPPLPLVASRLAGKWGPGSQIELTEIRPAELIERLARPLSLAGDATAFAIIVVGQSMSPRFRPGSRIAVTPRTPVAIGDDVLVRLNTGESGTERVLIGQLVKRSRASVELRQFNPDVNFSVDVTMVEAILRIPGELI